MQISNILRTLLATALAVNALTSTASALSIVSVQVDKKTAIKDGEICTVNVKLHKDYYANPPSQVEVTAPGLKCTRSVFTFDQNDPTTFDQQVQCRTTTGSAPAKDGAVIDVPVTCKYTGGTVPEDTQTIKRQVVSTGKCTGSGDPHMLTFDGVKYDFQAAGVFRLFESKNLLIQVFQEKCGPISKGAKAPSCYRGVSIAFGDSVLKLFVQNGKIALAKGSSDLDWFSIEKLGRADGYRVFMTADPSTYVDVNLVKWAKFNNYPYLNVALQISPYFKTNSVNGLMGNWNGVASDDVTDSARLTQTHGAPLNNNLLTCVGKACASYTKTSTELDATAKDLPSNLPNLHQGYEVVDADSIQMGAFTPTLNPLKMRQLRASVNDKKDVTARANQLCKQIATAFSECATYVDDTDYFVNKVCIADAVTLQDLSVVDSAKLGYLLACRREIDARLASTTMCVNETAKVDADRSSLYFGDVSKCSKQCSNRGRCLPAGCQCDLGYTGKGCDETI